MNCTDMTNSRVKSVLIASLFFCVISQSFAQRPDALELYRNDRFNEAIEVTLAEISENPRNMDSYTVLTWSLIGARRYQDVITYGQRALQVNQFDARIIESIGEAYYFLNQNEQALNRFQQYVTLAPNGGRLQEVYSFMGEIYLRLGEYHHADIAYSTAVYLSPRSSNWWLRLGFAREQLEDYEQARAAYERALALNPNLLEAQRGLQRVNSR